MTPDMLLAIKKVGVDVFLIVGVFALCVWIVRFMVMRMSIVMDKLVEKLEKHDRNALERGRYIKEEHGRMIDSLKEIQEGFGRINGYKEKG